MKAMQEEAERLNRLLPAEVVLLRSQLRTGEPCPVCGSLHHPAATLTEVQLAGGRAESGKRKGDTRDRTSYRFSY